MPTTYHKTIRMKKRFSQKKFYDLFDIRDEKITIGTKEDARHLHLWRRVVHIFIFDRKGKLLICKRPASKDAYPNLITSSAGGHVERGESYRAAAKRELYEELGLTASLKDFDHFNISGLHGKIITRLFIGHCAKEIRPDPKEIASHRFASISSLKKDIRNHPKKFAPPFRKAFTLFLKNNKKQPIQR